MSVEAMNNVIIAIDKGRQLVQKDIQLCNELTEVMPWKIYREAVIDLFLRPMNVVRCAQVVDEFQKLMDNVINNQFNASQSITETNRSTLSLFAVYLDLLQNRYSKTYETRRPRSIEMLHNVLSVISSAQSTLQLSGKNMEKTTKTLKSLKCYCRVAFISEAMAAGFFEKKFIPELLKVFGELKTNLEKLHKMFDDFDVDIVTTEAELKDGATNVGEVPAHKEDDLGE